ncbi:MAG: gamma-glutamyl-gamma-aminobutyrate hydrolase family protein [Acidimicrobiia bacterium]
MTRPVIGITAWRRVLDTFLGPELLQTLSTYYSDAAIEAGMTPIIFPNGQSPAEAERLVAMVDGLLISGGDDIDPVSYGAETGPAVTGESQEVDEFEVALVQAARDQNKPVLAICRGIQLLNVALGGTLAQDVTSDGGVHDLIRSSTDPEELNQRRHAIHLEDQSLLATVYEASELKVNTLHHQGIDRLAEDLIVEGRAPDGLIEAARCDGSWWAVGVQWHPERMESKDHNPLFSALREAIESV